MSYNSKIVTTKNKDRVGIKSTAAIARKALAGVKALKKKTDNEIKHLSYAPVNASITDDGQVDLVTRLAIGTEATVGTRVGNSVKLSSMNFSGYVNWNTTGAAGQVLKMFIIQDTQLVADSTPTYFDIFEDNNVNSFLNIDTLGRFRIVKKMTFVREQSIAQRQIDFTYKSSSTLRWNGPAYTDIQKGHYYIVCVSNSTTYAPSVNMRVRINYFDN